MSRHEQLAALWAQYHGQKGTPKQVAQLVQRLPEATLQMMLEKRGQIVRAS